MNNMVKESSFQRMVFVLERIIFVDLKLSIAKQRLEKLSKGLNGITVTRTPNYSTQEFCPIYLCSELESIVAVKVSQWEVLSENSTAKTLSDIYKA